MTRVLLLMFNAPGDVRSAAELRTGLKSGANPPMSFWMFSGIPALPV